MKLVRKNFCLDLEKMIDKGIHSLKRNNKKPPRKESLQLYRELYKFFSEFSWEDDRGVLWRDRLRESIRKEFEAA